MSPHLHLSTCEMGAILPTLTVERLGEYACQALALALALHGSCSNRFSTVIIIIAHRFNCYFMMTRAMGWSHRRQSISMGDSSVPTAPPHPPASQAQLSPAWHTPVAVDVPGWAGAIS